MGRFELSDFISAETYDESMLSDAERTHRDRIWSMMRDAVEYEPDIYERRTRGVMLRLIAEEYSVEKMYLYITVEFQVFDFLSAALGAENNSEKTGLAHNGVSAKIAI